KGGPEEGCPLKGVHEGIFLLRLGSMCGTTFELLSSHRGIVCPLAVALRIALGVVVVLEAGLSHKTSSAPPQRRNGRAFSSLTARGGGLPFGVTHPPYRRHSRHVARRTRILPGPPQGCPASGDWPDAVYSLDRWPDDAGKVRISSSGAAKHVSAMSHTGYAASEREREETRACQR